MVEPTIIANMGEGDTGKSDSIKRVYEKLMNVKIDRKDICEVVTINNVKVGIASDGDDIKIVEGNLDGFVDKGCQIILTACRSNHNSVVLLNEYKNKKQGYRIWRTSNARIYEYIDKDNPRVAPKGIQNRFNENWAEEIANLIEAWCYAGKEKG